VRRSANPVLRSGNQRAGKKDNKKTEGGGSLANEGKAQSQKVEENNYELKEGGEKNVQSRQHPSGEGERAE